MAAFTKRIGCALTALLLAASCGASLPVIAVEDSVQKYEFENGATSGGKIHIEGWTGNTQEDGSGEEMDLTGFSGTGFSYLDQKGTTVSVEVDAPEAGLYLLRVSYCEPYDANKKVQYLNINGVNQGEVSFKHNLEFSELDAGVVMLQKGKNTIEFKAYWGYTFFDYLTIEPAPEYLTNLSPERRLSNPDASDTTKRLFQYLCDQYGNHILSGQQEYCGEHNYNLWQDPTVFIKDNEEEFEYLLKLTGKQPAIRGIDFLVYRDGATWDDHAAERAAYWFNECHGIPTVTWHWNVPTEKGSEETAFYVESTGNTPFTTFSVTNAVTEGTWEHEQVMKDIDFLAAKLQILKDADVPVIFRPLHEAEGAWFWWGAEGPEPCKALYRLLYDRLTNEYGLNNLIWEWTGYTYETSAAWYPGDDVVDLIGYDKYNAADGLPNLSSISSTFYSLVRSTEGRKMVAMSENDTIPSLENLQNDKAGWLYFCPWYKNYLTSEQNNPADSVKEIYQSEYCITLDELPDIRTYPLPGEEATQPTETTETTGTTPDPSAPLYGDVDDNGKVELLDVILLNKNLLGIEQLSKKGTANADVDRSGTIDSSDSLNILKSTVNLVTLPVTQ
ncbi:MAG: glycoside hydrolase [Oscillospiraceae bacterium]|nr:glycoside hydrolase [Oscillospiraceae bacterium]